MSIHTCTKCKLEKDVTAFGWNKQRNKPNYWCKSCRVTYNSENDKKHQERIKKTRVKVKLKYNYGLSLEEVQNQLKHQNNRCAICNKEITMETKHVDHCHTTDKIRGLLCSKCNKGLGLFYDNVESLKNAIKYLKSEGVWN